MGVGIKYPFPISYEGWLTRAIQRVCPVFNGGNVELVASKHQAL